MQPFSFIQTWYHLWVVIISNTLNTRNIEGIPQSRQVDLIQKDIPNGRGIPLCEGHGKVVFEHSLSLALQRGCFYNLNPWLSSHKKAILSLLPRLFPQVDLMCLNKWLEENLAWNINVIMTTNVLHFLGYNYKHKNQIVMSPTTKRWF